MTKMTRSRSAPAPTTNTSHQTAHSDPEGSLSPAPVLFRSKADDVAPTPVINSNSRRPDGATVSSGAESKRKYRRRLSEATKAKKRKEAAKARRSATIAESGKQDELPKKSPKATKPKSLYNAELKTVGPEWEVEGIRGSRVSKKTRQYLVKWVGWPESANTWEPEVHLGNAAGKIKQFHSRK